MPIARIITPSQQDAQPVVEQLRARGYTVETVAPGDPCATPVDLEIVLEKHSPDAVLGRAAELLRGSDDRDVYIGAGVFPGRATRIVAPAPVVQSITDTINGVAAGLQNKRDLLAKALREQRAANRAARQASAQASSMAPSLQPSMEAAREWRVGDENVRRRVAEEAEALRIAEEAEVRRRAEAEALAARQRAEEQERLRLAEQAEQQERLRLAEQAEEQERARLAAQQASERRRADEAQAMEAQRQAEREAEQRRQADLERERWLAAVEAERLQREEQANIEARQQREQLHQQAGPMEQHDEAERVFSDASGQIGAQQFAEAEQAIAPAASREDAAAPAFSASTGEKSSVAHRPRRRLVIRIPHGTVRHRSRGGEWRAAAVVSSVLAVLLILGWRAVVRGPVAPLPSSMTQQQNLEQEVPFGSVTLKPASASAGASVNPHNSVTEAATPPITVRVRKADTPSLKPLAAKTSKRAGKAASKSRKHARHSARADELADDVVVRHFTPPPANQSNATQKAALKRYSDMK